MSGHFDARSIISREIGIACLACRTVAADIKRVEEGPLQIQSFPWITTTESLDDDIGKHSRQLRLQRIAAEGNFLTVVNPVAICIRLEWIRLISQDFEAIRQTVTVGIGLQRIRLVDVDFITVLETVAISVGLGRICLVGVHFLAVLEAVAVGISLVRIGI